MKCSKYFGAKQCGFIKSISVLAPKGVVHFLNETIKDDFFGFVCFAIVKVKWGESVFTKSKNVKVKNSTSVLKMKSDTKLNANVKIMISEKNCEATRDTLPLVRYK